MTAEPIEYVQHSFDQVRPLANHLGVVFYRRLFELDPTLRSLFKGDLHAQSRKFTQVLGTVVAHLHRAEDILPAVRDLGRRHTVYGVRPAHYDTVEAALLWALERSLGPAFTPALRAAWQSAYALLSGTMQSGAMQSGAMQSTPTEKQPSFAA
jgi:hemoglobin-like flavoprotein